MTLSELLGNVGFFGGAVMIFLAVLSIYSVGAIFDKQRRFRLASRQSQAFKPVFGKLLSADELSETIDAAKQYPNSHVAKVVSAGMLEYEAARRIGSDPASSLERVTIALENTRTESLIEMKRGLGLLATIGSTAPFVGLFGTVVGIINAFRGIAATGAGGMAAVSGGIAEALVATALGIFVAIPAVVAFNQFTGMLERFHVEMNQASSQLVTHLFHVRQVDDINVPVKAVVSGTKVSEAKAEVAHAAR